jgi:hypothetical protein
MKLLPTILALALAAPLLAEAGFKRIKNSLHRALSSQPRPCDKVLDRHQPVPGQNASQRL